MTGTPQAGQIVRVRQRQYFVEEVVPPGAGDDATLVRMSCLDDDAQGQPLEVLWEKEVDPELITAEAWQKIASRGFDPPKLFSAYLHTLQWNCVTSTDPNLFQSPFRAGIRIDAYQLEPLQKALRLPRVNLFIADDVGLGKTIEAGLIARELLLRKKVQDIVVACPPSMLLQWQDELEDRFGHGLPDPRQGLHRPGPAGAGLRGQPLDDPLAVPGLAPPADRRGLHRHAARLARRLPARLAAHPRRGPPRRAVERREVRHRLEDHPGRPRPGRTVRAPAVPLGHAAQRALEQLLRPAGDPRPAALLPGRPRPVQEGPRRRHGPPTQGGPPGRRGRIPQASRPADRLERPAGRHPRAAAFGAARPVPGAEGGTTQERDEAQAGHRGAADLRAATASALLGGGLRPHAPRPPPHRAAAMGRGRGRAGPSRTTMPASRRSSPRASTTTTTGPRSPRKNSRPRKRPRSRRPRSTRRPPGRTPSPARSRSSTR